MDSLKAIIGLIFILQKTSFGNYWPMLYFGKESAPTYWAEKCRLRNVESPRNTEIKATLATVDCFRPLFDELRLNDTEALNGETACRIDKEINKCHKPFFEVLSPCLTEGEADEMLGFFLEINEDVHNFMCSGSMTWMDGLICILPKMAFGYLWPMLYLEEESASSYWAEKCRLMNVESPKDLEMMATTATMNCFLPLYLPSRIEDLMASRAENDCRVEKEFSKCLKIFFDVLSPCLKEGYAEEMLAFFLEINEDVYNFMCSGPVTWMDDYWKNNGHNCKMSKSREINQCKNTVYNQTAGRWLADSGDLTSDSFQEFFCRFFIDLERCNNRVTSQCDNYRAAILNDDYVNYLQNVKVCASKKTSGCAKVPFNLFAIISVSLLALAIGVGTRWRT